MPIDVIGVLLESSFDLDPSYSSGFHLRGLFYRVLRSRDPGLSSRLHGFKGLAPYSISPLMRVEPKIYFFRVASYLTRLSDALIKAFSDVKHVELMNGSFRVVEISYKRLELEKLLEDSQPCRRYEIEFVSPTCFRRPCPYVPHHLLGFIARIMRLVGKPKSHYRFYPLPDPILMLRNLKRQWDQYAGLTLRVRGFTRWLEEGGVAVSGISNLRTHRLLDRARRRFFVGFTGKVRLSLPEDTFKEDAARAVNLLLRIGEETQVGVNRTAGFGVYRITKMLASPEK